MTVSSSLTTSAEQQRVAGWLAAEEFHLLEAICEAFFPSLTPPEESTSAVAAYYQRNAGDLRVATHMAEALAQESASAQTDFRQLLALMASPASGLLLVGSPKSFMELTPEQRERYLQAMAQSGLAQLRQGFQALKRLAGFLYYAVPDERGVNENWEVLDYSVQERSALRTQRPIKPLAIAGDMILECDAVVIGSGAGGGVVAGELAMSGKNVVVLEMGGYNSEDDFTLQEAQAMPALYLNHGMLATRDLNTIILAGSTLGGGTVVNWTTSFRTPENILDEWADISGLKLFRESALQESFAEVERRVSVNTENSAHNWQNQLLFDGAKALGYHVGTLRRNAVGCNQRCGTCGFGCAYGCKQSTMRTYLQDAFDQGARIVVGCRAEKVLIKDGKAVGVEAWIHDRETGARYKVTVRAKAVVVAAGAINSPAILLRSGLENKHIGRHLHLHPTSVIAALYPEKVYPWQGVMQSVYSDEFAHLQGNYGYKLEVPPVHPGLMGLATPWYSAREYREWMVQVASAGHIIILTCDRGEGSVSLDAHNEPVVEYVTSVFDRRHLLHGLRTAARIHFAAGASEVFSLQSKRTVARRSAEGTVSERTLCDFDAQLERSGLGPNRIMMFSAHQMGTCRMGADAKKSVTDGHGEIYGVKGLFVCDGSVFPAASGVNPMLSIMALAHANAQYIKTMP